MPAATIRTAVESRASGTRSTSESEPLDDREKFPPDGEAPPPDDKLEVEPEAELPLLLDDATPPAPAPPPELEDAGRVSFNPLLKSRSCEAECEYTW